MAEYKDRPSDGHKGRAWAVADRSRRAHRVYPYVVKLAVDADKLNVELNRGILHFHKSRNIQVQHRRTIIRETQIYFRWCFSDPATAHAFIEQFGGEIQGSVSVGCLLDPDGAQPKPAQQNLERST